MDDCNFHECANLESFDVDRTISLVRRGVPEGGRRMSVGCRAEGREIVADEAWMLKGHPLGCVHGLAAGHPGEIFFFLRCCGGEGGHAAD